jgi:lipoprotein-releasing system permease protein
MPYEFFIGLRYLRARRKQAFVMLTSIIPIGGIFLGVAAMIVVLAVMSGFEEDLKGKILGTNAHVVVMNQKTRGIENYPEIVRRVEKVEGVAAASPFIYQEVMLTSEIGVAGAVMRGIDPAREERVTDLKKNLKWGRIKDLTPTAKEGAPDGIIIGKELARRLNVFLNDPVTVVSPLGTMGPLGMLPKMKKYRVVGIFEAGMYQYDSSLAYVSIPSAQSFFKLGDTVTAIEVRVKDIYQARQIAERVQKELQFPFWTRDWMQMNRNLFSALKLEKLAMFIILTLITVVAAFSIISTLIMMVMEKSKDIAILIAMGATRKSVMMIFIAEGMIMGALGTLLGVLAGWGICALQDKYHLVKMAGDVYYISVLPVLLKPSDLVVVAVSALLLSFLATLYPSYRASKLDPAVALRGE